MTRAALIACTVSLGWPAAAAAHRLDEYLQATRITVGHRAVDVEIDLTPGVSVAAPVVTLIDANNDGALSPAERAAYAAQIVTLAELKIDGAPVPLVLIDSEYPSVAQMRAGTGTIHLRARSALLEASPGPHELIYVNAQHPEMSAYLVNALVPPSGVHIAAQQRDPSQHHLTLDYVVDGPQAVAWRIAGGIGTGTLMICALIWFRRSDAQQRRQPAESGLEHLHECVAPFPQDDDVAADRDELEAHVEVSARI